MTSSPPPSPLTICVIGATGQQGGSVVTSLLDHNHSTHSDDNIVKFKIIAISRDPESIGSQSLKSIGVTVIKASVDDKKSLVSAFQGVFAVFGMTSPVGFTVQKDGISKFHSDGKNDQTKSDITEFTFGKNIVDAIEESKVPYFIWSSLPNLTEMTNGKYPMPIFHNKAKVEQYAKSKSTFHTITLIAPGFYENYFRYPLRESVDGTGYMISLPMSGKVKGPWFSVKDDMGKYVLYALLNLDKTKGKTIWMEGDCLSSEECAEVFTKVFKKKVEFMRITDNDFISSSPLGPILITLYRALDEVGDRYYEQNNEESVKDSNIPKGTKMEEWLTKNKNHKIFDNINKK